MISKNSVKKVLAFKVRIYPFQRKLKVKKIPKILKNCDKKLKKKNILLKIVLILLFLLEIIIDDWFSSPSSF